MRRRHCSYDVRRALDRIVGFPANGVGTGKEPSLARPVSGGEIRRRRHAARLALTGHRVQWAGIVGKELPSAARQAFGAALGRPSSVCGFLVFDEA
jgi:hypothetical protein